MEKEAKKTRYFYYLLICISFLFGLKISWFKWGDLIIDTFRDPWIAYKITQGNFLYRDISYNFGILPPYVMAFLFFVFGQNINCSVFLGIFLTSITLFLTYRVSRLFLTRFFSTLTALNFIFVFAFGHYTNCGIFNFILPYNLASIFFIVFLLSAILFFCKYLKKKKNNYLFYWILSMYFIFLSRIYMSFLVWIVFTFIYIIYVLKNKNKHSITSSIYIILPPLFALVTYYLFLYFGNAFEGFYEGVLGKIMGKGRSKWELMLSGFGRKENIFVVIISFSYQVLSVYLIYGLSTLFPLIKKKTKNKIFNFLFYLTAFVISMTMAAVLHKLVHYHNQFTLMPLLLISGIVVNFYSIFKRGKYNFLDISSLTLFFLSFALILRIVLRAVPVGYAFYLLIPGLICYYYFFSKIFPFYLTTLLKFKYFEKKYYFFSVGVLFIMLMLPFILENYTTYKKKKLVIHGDRGDILYFPSYRGIRFYEVIEYLKKNTNQDTTVIVFPEGIGINFLSSRDNPLRYFCFIPTEVICIGEDKVIEAITKNHVDIILLIHRPTSEHGYPVFGRDYAEKIYSWMQGNYILEKLIGPYPFTTDEFGIAIYRKKDISPENY